MGDPHNKERKEDPTMTEELRNRIIALWQRDWTPRDISILLDVSIEEIRPVVEEEIRRTYAPALPRRDHG